MLTEIELVIRPDGTVESPWWTPEIAEYLCSLCGRWGSEECENCLNRNPWCG
jgi:hypothetical protein